MLLELYKNIPQNIAPSAHLLGIVFVCSQLDFLRFRSHVGYTACYTNYLLFLIILPFITMLVVHNGIQWSTYFSNAGVSLY